MIEKVNPKHPDKLADRIAGAIVDLGYTKSESPKVAVEILIGHGECNIIIESTEGFNRKEIQGIVSRLAGDMVVNITLVPQDRRLMNNQHGSIKCGDNGIFKGLPLTEEEKKISEIAREIYRRYSSDGKYVLDGDKLIICQSKARKEDLACGYPNAIINPLGYWDGGLDVDTGAVNRKLGSDMAMAVTGGGLHGKDLSKADVSVNIYAFIKAQETGKEVNISCAIGDKYVDGKPYSEIVEIANKFIENLGGFEKFAEWGLY